MIYKREGSPHYMAKWKHNGRLIYRNTKERTIRAARLREIELRSEFNREQAERKTAAARFSCDEGLLARCAECEKLFRTDRAVFARDNKKLCGDLCRIAWDRRVSPVPLLRDFLTSEFLPFVRARHATKKKTVVYYDYGARSLAESNLGTVRLDAITSQHAAAYASKHGHVTASTVNCALRTLRHALNLAVEWGKLPSAPRVPLMKGERQRDRVVTEAEFAAYIEACEQPWRDVALLIRGEGMCPGECYKLRWEHVLLDDGRDDRHGLIQIAEGKTKARRRLLPMVVEVSDALRSRWTSQGRPASGWVFPAESRSGHFEQGSAKNYHARAVRATGVAFEPYCLRHTALTRFAESGCDAFTLAKIAGHSSITMTGRYCHPQAEAIARAFRKLTAPKL
jgi:integrase/recombinase XerD